MIRVNDRRTEYLRVAPRRNDHFAWLRQTWNAVGPFVLVTLTYGALMVLTAYVAMSVGNYAFGPHA